MLAAYLIVAIVVLIIGFIVVIAGNVDEDTGKLAITIAGFWPIYALILVAVVTFTVIVAVLTFIAEIYKRILHK